MQLSLRDELGKIGKSDEFKAAMADYYLAPHSCVETAKHFGMSKTGARKILAKLGILRPHFSFPDGVEEQILRLWDEGVTLAKIERELKVDAQKVAKYLKRRGIEKLKRNAGPNHPNWTGGRSVDRGGYVKIWIPSDSPYFGWAGKRNDVAEHRLVMAKHLGRPLLESETVHHIDGNTMNNTIENLELHQGKHGRGAIMCCLECGSKRVGFAPLED
jgi:hypothetical protein